MKRQERGMESGELVAQVGDANSSRGRRLNTSSSAHSRSAITDGRVNNRSGSPDHSSDDCDIAPAYNPSLVDPTAHRMRQFIGLLCGAVIACPRAAQGVAKRPLVAVLLASLRRR
jgi:hypothetical protein